MVPPALVDLAEVVDVEAEQCQGMAFPAGALELPLAEAEEGAAGGQSGDRTEVGLAAQFQFPHRQVRQPLQLLHLGFAQLARLAVDHAEGAEVVAIGAAQRGTGVKPDVGFRLHQGVVPEPLVGEGIGHHQHRIAGDGVGAEGVLPAASPSPRSPCRPGTTAGRPRPGRWRRSVSRESSWPARRGDRNAHRSRSRAFGAGRDP